MSRSAHAIAVLSPEQEAMALLPPLSAALATKYPRVPCSKTVHQFCTEYKARREAFSVDLDSDDDEALDMEESLSKVTSGVEDHGPLSLIIDVDGDEITNIKVVIDSFITEEQRQSLIQMSAFYLLAEKDPIIQAYQEMCNDWDDQDVVLSIWDEDVAAMPREFVGVYRQEYTRSSQHPPLH